MNVGRDVFNGYYKTGYCQKFSENQKLINRQTHSGFFYVVQLAFEIQQVGEFLPYRGNYVVQKTGAFV